MDWVKAVTFTVRLPAFVHSRKIPARSTTRRQTPMADASAFWSSMTTSTRPIRLPKYCAPRAMACKPSTTELRRSILPGRIGLTLSCSI